MKTPNRPKPGIAGSALFSEQAWEAIAHSLKLLRRELQIVKVIFDDQTEYAIAKDLGISAGTVHTYTGRLHRKLGIANRAQLLVRVMQEFLALTASPGHGLPAICASLTACHCALQR